MGALAGLVLRGGGHGLVGDLIGDVTGALIGGFVLILVGQGAHGFGGTLVTAFIGACILHRHPTGGRGPGHAPGLGAPPTRQEAGHMAHETDETERRGEGPTPLGTISAGTPVYDVSGQRVGTVVAAHPQERYLEMRRGLVLHRIVYVPFWAIARTGPHAIYLTLTDEDLHGDGWNRPPLGPAIVYEGPARWDGAPPQQQTQQEEE